MHSVVLLPLFGALVTAQGIDFDVIDAIPPSSTSSIDILAKPTLIPYDQDAAVAQVKSALESDVSNPAPLAIEAPEALNARNIEKRAACDPLGKGYGPISSPDTADFFLQDPQYNAIAKAAAKPQNYTIAFQGLNASNSAYGYMGYTTLQAYDPLLCASKCTGLAGCASFNIYLERDPALEPGPQCTNPTSVTNIKCAFWGGPVSAANANNDGQWRENFHVVISGSNGYVSTGLDIPDGYSSGVYLGNTAINATANCNGDDTHLGSKVFYSGLFDAKLCAAACTATDGCHFFNTYLVLKNGASIGQYCAMYSQAWPTTYATYSGQMNGTDKYTVTYSYAFTNATNPGQPRYACDVTSATSLIATQPSLQSFCSSLLGYTTPIVTVTATATTVVTGFSTVTIQAPNKRAINTPSALSTFAATAITSACSLKATPVTSASTVFTYVTATVTTASVTTVTAAPKHCYVIGSGGFYLSDFLADNSGNYRVQLTNDRAGTLWYIDSDPFTTTGAVHVRNRDSGRLLYGSTYNTFALTSPSADGNWTAWQFSPVGSVDLDFGGTFKITNVQEGNLLRTAGDAQQVGTRIIMSKPGDGSRINWDVIVFDCSIFDS